MLCRAWSARSRSCLVEEVFAVLGQQGLGSAYWSARSGFCVLVGVGHGVGFFFFFLIWVFVSGGFWWAVGSGGMVEAR